MTLRFLVLVVVLAGAPVAAQAPATSSSDAEASPREDAASTELPVSIDRIREALEKAPPQPLLRGVSERPTFTIGIEERLILEDFFKPEDFQVGPVPPGGLYAHEMQQVVSNPVGRPLAQPYAAFSGGELATLAIESLLFKYLGQRMTRAFTNAQGAAAQAAAEAEVAQAIAEYCAAQPGRGANIEICRRQIAPR